MLVVEPYLCVPNQKKEVIHQHNNTKVVSMGTLIDMMVALIGSNILFVVLRKKSLICRGCSIERYGIGRIFTSTNCIHIWKTMRMYDALVYLLCDFDCYELFCRHSLL